MCEPSGGLVANVNDTELAQSVSDALIQKTIASHLKVTIRLDRHFKLRNEAASDLRNE